MKRALVTGGNKGIGLAIVNRLLAADLHVVALAQSEWDEQRPNCEAIVFDLTNVGEIPALAEKLGNFDVLVNNAGIMNALPFDDYPDADRDRMFAINLLAPVALMREVGRQMREQGSGRIINMASIAAYGGHPDVWYGVTKAGLISASQSYARFAAEEGVSTFTVAPGPVEGTDLFQQIPEERRRKQQAESFHHRFTAPDEVAALVAWLATDAPTSLSGQTININNGRLLR